MKLSLQHLCEETHLRHIKLETSMVKVLSYFTIDLRHEIRHDLVSKLMEYKTEMFA